METICIAFFSASLTTTAGIFIAAKDTGDTRTFVIARKRVFPSPLRATTFGAVFLLEGGATLNAAFLAENLIQRAYVYMGAKVFGGAAAKSPIAGGGVLLPSEAADLHLAEVQTFGNDVLCVYDFPKQEAK